MADCGRDDPDEVVHDTSHPDEIAKGNLELVMGPRPKRRKWSSRTGEQLKEICGMGGKSISKENPPTTKDGLGG